MASLYLSLIVCAFLLSLAHAQSGGGIVISTDLPPQPCTQFSRDYYVPGLNFKINGTQVIAYPSSEYGSYDNTTAVVYQVQNVTEQYRLPNNPCRSFSDVVLQYVELNTCSCSLLPILEEENGHRREGIALRFSHCAPAESHFNDQSNFSMTISYSTSNVTYSEPYNTTVPGSAEPSFSYTHYANGLKIGYNLTGWNWANWPLDQYLSLYTYTGIRTDTNVDMSVTLDQYRTYANFAFSQGRRAQLVTDSGLILDGKPSLAPADNPPLRSFAWPPTEGAWWYFPTPQDFCQPINESTKMTNWFEIIYDPSILSVFSQAPTPSALDPSSPNPKASKNATLAIVLSVVLVLLLLTALIIVFTFVPVARNCIRPYAQRSERSGQAALVHDSNAKADWHSGKKPDTIVN